MNHRLKVTAIGNSAGIVLPKEVLVRMRIEKGDELSVTETPRGIELTPSDREFEEQMAVARKVMKKYRAALRELAK